MFIGRQYIKDLRAFSPQLRQIARDGNRNSLLVQLDCILCGLVHGANVAQYIGFSMYRMNPSERRQYVTKGRSDRIEKRFNTSREEARLLENKHTFNERFSGYVRRGWLYAQDHSVQELSAFLKKYPEVMVKPVNLSKGRGVYRLETAAMDDAALADTAQELMGRDVLLEAFIRQHPALSAVNPTSVNTIRICSARDRSGEVHIIGASLRAGGADSVVDNLHAGGVQYPVDVETGVVLRGGVRFDGTKNVLFHPSTGTKVIGMQIPNWDAVIRTVKEAGKIPKDLRYIGWDVAVTQDGCELIEMNIGQGSNGMQLDGVGKFPIIREMY